MSIDQQIFLMTKDSEKWKNGITARLLRNYADSLVEREKLGETCIDSDLPHVLVRAAKLLEEHCPDVIRHEKKRNELRQSL